MQWRDAVLSLLQPDVFLQAENMAGGNHNWSVADTTVLLEIFKDMNKM